jgi:hypothetical protein
VTRVRKIYRHTCGNRQYIGWHSIPRNMEAARVDLVRGVVVFISLPVLVGYFRSVSRDDWRV